MSSKTLIILFGVLTLMLTTLAHFTEMYVYYGIAAYSFFFSFLSSRLTEEDKLLRGIMTVIFAILLFTTSLSELYSILHQFIEKK